MTFVGIFNPGENKQIALELNVKAPHTAREGGQSTSSGGQPSRSLGVWVADTTVLGACKEVTWAALVRVQLRPAVADWLCTAVPK